MKLFGKCALAIALGLISVNGVASTYEGPNILTRTDGAGSGSSYYIYVSTSRTGPCSDPQHFWISTENTAEGIGRVARVHAAALAAQLSGRSLKIVGTGTCIGGGTSGQEIISYVNVQ